MNLYTKLENYTNKNQTKLRIYISSVFALILLYNIQEMLSDEIYTIMLVAFVLAPIVIYYIVTLIFPTKDSK